jgi:hypothetical protein
MSDVHARVFKEAAHTLGGMEQLARALNVDLADLQIWCDGVVQPPVRPYLVALDIIAGTPRPS